MIELLDEDVQRVAQAQEIALAALQALNLCEELGNLVEERSGDAGAARDACEVHDFARRSRVRMAVAARSIRFWWRLAWGSGARATQRRPHHDSDG